MEIRREKIENIGERPLRMFHTGDLCRQNLLKQSRWKNTEDCFVGCVMR